MKASRSKFFFVGYTALIIAGFFSWYIHRTLTTSQAAADHVTITFAPKAASSSVSAQQDVDVLIQTAGGDKKISGLDVTFKSDGPIRFTNVTDPVPFPGTDTGLFNQVVRTVADDSIRISYVSLKPNTELPSVVKIRLSFFGTGEGVGKVFVDQTQTQIVGNIAEKAYGIESADEGTYTITQESMAHSVSARIDPASFEVPLTGDSDYMVALAITDIPEGKKISAYQFVLKYDPALIEVTAIDDPFDAATGTDSNKFNMIRKSINAATGTIELAYTVPLPDDQLPTRPKQFIHLKGKTIGAGELNIESSQITGNIAGGAYVVNVFDGSYEVVDIISTTPTQPPTASCSVDSECADNQLCSSNICVDLPCRAEYAACIRTVPSNHTCAIEYAPDGFTCENNGICQSGICTNQSEAPSPTPTISTTPGNIVLNMKLKFQGILSRSSGHIATMKVKITLAGSQAGNELSQIVDFTLDEQGVWLGQATFNASAASGYKVLVKGEKHLQKRICDIEPAETASGTYRCGDTGKITLQSGENELDFSNIILLSGDLPDQDGVVDAYDISYIRLNLGSTDPKSLSIGDLNFDGVLDTQDFSLLVASLNVKYDEL